MAPAFPGHETDNKNIWDTWPDDTAGPGPAEGRVFNEHNGQETGIIRGGQVGSLSRASPGLACFVQCQVHLLPAKHQASRWPPREGPGQEALRRLPVRVPARPPLQDTPSPAGSAQEPGCTPLTAGVGGFHSTRPPLRIVTDIVILHACSKRCANMR